jgi:hypothetical protein
MNAVYLGLYTVWCSEYGAHGPTPATVGDISLGRFSSPLKLSRSCRTHCRVFRTHWNPVQSVKWHFYRGCRIHGVQISVVCTVGDHRGLCHVQDGQQDLTVSTGTPVELVVSDVVEVIKCLAAEIGCQGGAVFVIKVPGLEGEALDDRSWGVLGLTIIGENAGRGVCGPRAVGRSVACSQEPDEVGET